MIVLLRERATREQLAQMLELAGGGALHADCEAVLLDDGSAQDDIWGADWIPVSQRVRFEALINIRPRQNNFSLTILDRDNRERVERVVRDLLEGV